MSPKLRIGLAAAITGLVLDQATKLLIVHQLIYGEKIAVIEGFFYLTHVRNPGAAFGLFATAPAQWRVFFFIGIYLGFIQMGVGVFLLTGLVLGVGYDVVRGNAVKVLIILCCTAIALGIFIYSDKVDWEFGLLLACGNMAGSPKSTHYFFRHIYLTARYC